MGNLTKTEGRAPKLARVLRALILTYAVAALTSLVATVVLVLKPGFADPSDPTLVLVKVQMIANRISWITVGFIVILSLQSALALLWTKEG